jgi:hypothetical protein
MEMSDYEIIARRYLNQCNDGLIVKDSLNQIELKEDNFKNIDEYYNKCKDIVGIYMVAEDGEYYNMNWDCLIVRYGNNTENIWQRE